MNASLKTRKNVVTFFTYLVLILGSISMIFPFVWMVLTSFKTQAESMAIPPQILPSHWNLDSFVKALQSLPFTNLYLNTGLLILFRVIFAVVFSSMAGYAFAKLEFPCKKLLFGLVLIQMMLPSQIFIIPQYQMLAKMAAITRPTAAMACQASGAWAKPTASSIAKPEPTMAARASHTMGKKREKTPCHRARRWGGGSASAAGRRQKWAKLMPPTHTMTPARCTKSMR